MGLVYKHAQELIDSVEAGDDDAHEAAVQALNQVKRTHDRIEATFGPGGPTSYTLAQHNARQRRTKQDDA